MTRCKQLVGGRVQAGLAPHHDDVELFVCHTEGRKRWRVYAPTAGFALPTRSSGDLPAAGLGEPLLEAVLEPGDVLYLPRGTVHAAEAEGGAGACHVTVSMYQRWTLATALQVPCWPMSSGQAAGGARLHAVNGIQQHTSTDSLLRDWRAVARSTCYGVRRRRRPSRRACRCSCAAACPRAFCTSTACRWTPRGLRVKQARPLVRPVSMPFAHTPLRLIPSSLWSSAGA